MPPARPMILVTGATGTVGSEVVKALIGKPVQIRAAFHANSRPPKLRGPNLTYLRMDFDKPVSVARALKGVDRVFLLTPFTEDQVAMGRQAVALCERAGVEHIVKLSAAGADAKPGIRLAQWHRAVEMAIEESGVPYTHLRPCSFMQNFLGFFKPQKGKIFLPWGKGKTALIDVRDVAAVAAKALTGTAYANKAFTLTGPQALSGEDVAEIISKVTRKKISYVDMPDDAMRAAMEAMKNPPWAVDALMELHGLTRKGFAKRLTGTIKELLGREPLSFEAFARDHAKLF